MSQIKAVLNFNKMTPGNLLSNASAIYTQMDNNTYFAGPPAPPVDMPTFLAANTALASANSAALDGGKKAITQQTQDKEAVVKILSQLGHYVGANCKNDMTIFVSSGFTAASTTKTAAAPVSEAIRKIVAGPNSGQMLVTPVKYPDAASYEVRFGPLPAGVSSGTPAVWASQPIVNVRSATTIPGLTPATIYVFQVRALTKAGYTDWSDPITRIAT